MRKVPFSTSRPIAVSITGTTAFDRVGLERRVEQRSTVNRRAAFLPLIVRDADEHLARALTAPTIIGSEAYVIDTSVTRHLLRARPFGPHLRGGHSHVQPWED